ncbi:MAG: 3-keto-disaccharide hydrolase [Isosphaeraceae bacterium]
MNRPRSPRPGASKPQALMLALAPVLLAALAILSAAPAASAQEEKDSGFRPLFNGKDLTGWITPEDKTLFTVKDGEIVGRTGTEKLKKNEFLVTDKAYGDFILKVKVKIRNGNSGIQFRSKRADDGVVSGPQADVADDQWGLLYEERRRGMIQRYPLDKARKLLKPDGWQEFVITAKGDHVTIDLNGTRIIERDDPKFDRKGIIALQIHVWPEPMEVRFKDIEIKEL